MRHALSYLASLSLGALALALPGTLHAEAGLPEAGAARAAIDAHPRVAAARARLASAQAESRALARGPNEVSVSTSYVRRSIEREGGYDEFDAEITRPVRLPGKAPLDRAIGRHGISAAENRAETARHQAALLLAQHWWDWLGAASAATVDRQAVQNYEKLLTAVRRRVALRDAAALEADQTEAALATARLAAENSAGSEALARARLMAQFPSLTLPAQPPEMPAPDAADAALSRLRDQILAENHNIAAADADADRQKALAERARRDRVADPSVGIRLFSERGGEEQGAGVLFSMPLGGGHRRALADQAAADAGAMRAEAAATRFDVQETAEADLAEARFRIQAWQRARQGLDAQLAALMKLRRGHEAGEIDLTDMLYGERQVHDAFRAEAAARAETLRAVTRLRIDGHDLWLTD